MPQDPLPASFSVISSMNGRSSVPFDTQWRGGFPLMSRGLAEASFTVLKSVPPSRGSALQRTRRVSGYCAYHPNQNARCEGSRRRDV